MSIPDLFTVLFTESLSLWHMDYNGLQHCTTERETEIFEFNSTANPEFWHNADNASGVRMFRFSRNDHAHASSDGNHNSSDGHAQPIAHCGIDSNRQPYYSAIGYGSGVPRTDVHARRRRHVGNARSGHSLASANP